MLGDGGIKTERSPLPGTCSQQGGCGPQCGGVHVKARRVVRYSGRFLTAPESWEHFIEKVVIEMALVSSSLPGEEVRIVTLCDMVVNCEFYFTDCEAAGGFNQRFDLFLLAFNTKTNVWNVFVDGSREGPGEPVKAPPGRNNHWLEQPREETGDRLSKTRHSLSQQVWAEGKVLLVESLGCHRNGQGCFI